jgi:hypothetical protein
VNSVESNRWKWWRRAVLATLTVGGFASAAFGQEVLTPQTPTVFAAPRDANLRLRHHSPFIRWTEDWSFPHCRRLRSDRLDRLKYIPLSTSPEMALGEIRPRFSSLAARRPGNGELNRVRIDGLNHRPSNGYETKGSL